MRDNFESYLDRLRGQDKAEGTIQQYSGGLRAFGDWLEEEDLEPIEATPRDIEDYLAWLKNEREYAPKTVRGYFSPVSGFYGDLKKAGKIEDDPTDDVTVADYAPEETRRQQETKQERVWFTKEELRQVVENVPAPKTRNRLLVLFQYYTGLRRQEVVDVKLDDLDKEERTVQVRGKGNKIHTAHWQPKLDGLLTAWIDGGYRDASPYAEESDYLFLTNTAPKLGADRLNKVVVQAAEDAGLQEVLFEDRQGRSHYKYTSHALRHSFAMHWLENGGSIEGLSKNMAHSSVTTTEIYTEILDERAKEEYEKYAPQIDI